MLCVLLSPAFVTYRMELPLSPPILATHPLLLPTLIKAHLDSNQRNLCLPFLPQLLCNLSVQCAEREESMGRSHYLGNLVAPEADIGINRCRAVVRLDDGHSSASHHARGIHNFVTVHQSSQQLSSTSFIPHLRGP
jgi:hypothetical protein